MIKDGLLLRMAGPLYLLRLLSLMAAQELMISVRQKIIAI
jgi:hypothetical protein